MAEERTDKLTSGNTAGPTDRSYSISGLGVKGKDPNDSLEILKGSSKATAMVPMNRVGGPGIVHAGCWAHARRKFFDAVKLNPKDQTAIGIVAQMDQLFAIDAQAGPVHAPGALPAGR